MSSDEIYQDMVQDLEDLFEELGFEALIVRTPPTGDAIIIPVTLVRIGKPKRSDDYEQVGDTEWIIQKGDFVIRKGDLIRVGDDDEVVMEAEKIQPARVLIAWKARTSFQ